MVTRIQMRTLSSVQSPFKNPSHDMTWIPPHFFYFFHLFIDVPGIMSNLLTNPDSLVIVFVVRVVSGVVRLHLGQRRADVAGRGSIKIYIFPLRGEMICLFSLGVFKCIQKMAKLCKLTVKWAHRSSNINIPEAQLDLASIRAKAIRPKSPPPAIVLKLLF